MPRCSWALALRSFLPAVSAQGWEPAIRDFEEQDKVHPPKPGCIVFAGSSSFRFWDTLVSDMKPLDVINRGFGGSEFSDLDNTRNRIVVAYRPRAVVVYEGDNDLAEGSSKTPEMVANDFRKFVQTVHAALPDTWIYILAIKPSKLRWNQWPQMKAANKLMQDYAATQKTCAIHRHRHVHVRCQWKFARRPVQVRRPAPDCEALRHVDRDHQTDPAPAIWASPKSLLPGFLTALKFPDCGS